MLKTLSILLIAFFWATIIKCHKGTNTIDLPELRDGEPCIEGKAYRVECNTCHCGRHNSLICTKMACLNWPTKKGKLRTKNEQTIEDLAEVCVPGKVYKKGCQRCFCTDLKEAECTNKECSEIPKTLRTYEDAHPKLNDDATESLPALAHEAARCIPGKRYRVDCNPCLCLLNGNLLCGQRICLSVEEVNRIKANKLNGKACTAKEVSESECMKCKCSHGKYECTPIPDCLPPAVAKRRHGATSNLRTKLNLSMDVKVVDKCIPKMVYKSNCNYCYCQSDATLRCTRKGCLNYRQSQRFEEQRQKLLLTSKVRSSQ